MATSVTACLRMSSKEREIFQNVWNLGVNTDGAAFRIGVS